MNGVLIDSCVLLDLFTNDVHWGDWSENALERYSQTNTLYINSIIYAEGLVHNSNQVTSGYAGLFRKSLIVML
jgi:predicted nucleic-acid-binding protein